jgi:hypothetical protein
MGIPADSRQQLEAIIKDKIKRENIERLARMMCSNLCENYMGCLVKYTEGKRLNFSQSDSWAVIQQFVIGLKSNDNYTTEILNRVGGTDSKTRQQSLKSIKDHKALLAERKKAPENKARRKASRSLALKRMNVESAKKEAHKSGKMDPREDGKSSVVAEPASETKGRKRKRPQCQNCGDVGHTARTCPEPRYDNKKPKTRKKRKHQNGELTEDGILDMFGLAE